MYSCHGRIVRRLRYGLILRVLRQIGSLRSTSRSMCKVYVPRVQEGPDRSLVPSSSFIHEQRTRPFHVLFVQHTDRQPQYLLERIKQQSSIQQRYVLLSSPIILRSKYDCVPASRKLQIDSPFFAEGRFLWSILGT